MSAFTSVARISLSRTSIGGVLGQIPGVSDSYSRWALHRRDVGGVFSGVYASHDDAVRAIPADRLAGWDSDEAADVFRAPLPRQLSVYPAMFWLARHLQAGDHVVDLGGGAAITQRQFTARARLPDGARWTIVETPAVARFGAGMVARGELDGVQFVDSLEAAGRCDILLSAGALQYMPDGLDVLARALEARPRAVILNKLPLSDDADYWTLQNIGPAVCPYRVWRRADFLAALAAHGYQPEDTWSVGELSCDIPFHPRLCVPAFTGMVLTRSAGEA